MPRHCKNCESLERLNDRYRDTIERLTRERDELRQVELVLSQLLSDKLGEPDVRRTRP
jgi:hypothetical protein